MTSTLMPEVHDALSHAMAAAPAKRKWPRRRVGLLAMGAVILGGSAWAATTGWHPTLGDNHRGHPQEAHASVPNAQLAALAVLRRPQTNADRVPQVRGVLRLLVRGEINGVHVNDVRVLRHHAGGITLLVPAERVGRHDMGYPSDVHRQVLCVLTTFRGGARQPSGAGQVCGGLHQLRTTGIGLSTALGSNRLRKTSAGLLANQFVTDTLVPDGVARVTVRVRGGRTITLPVINNVFQFISRNGPPPYLGTRWFDAHGRPIAH